MVGLEYMNGFKQEDGGTWQLAGASDICKGTVRGRLGRNQIMGDSEYEVQEFRLDSFGQGEVNTKDNKQ